MLTAGEGHAGHNRSRGRAMADAEPIRRIDRRGRRRPSSLTAPARVTSKPDNSYRDETTAWKGLGILNLASGVYTDRSAAAVDDISKLARL
jgi:hypothetical protein